MIQDIVRRCVLPQVGRRWLSTSAVCHRSAQTPRDKQLWFRTPQTLTKQPQILSAEDIQVHLDQFLATVNRRLEHLLHSSRARRETAGNSLTDGEYDKLVINFRDSVMANLTQRLEDGKYTDAPARIPTPMALFETHRTGGTTGLDSLILQFFNLYYLARGHHSLKDVNHFNAVAVADMRNPGEWYPGARNMRRKIIMHVGPTNSGKTYRALTRLESANSGWYGGP